MDVSLESNSKIKKELIFCAVMCLFDHKSPRNIYFLRRLHPKLHFLDKNKRFHPQLPLQHSLIKYRRISFFIASSFQHLH